MRALVVGGLLLGLAFVLGPTPSSSRAYCGQTSCGVPSCWNPTVRARPDIVRTETVACSGAIGARLVSGPAHGEISNVSTDWSGLHFDIHPTADAPRWDEAVLEITGHEGTIEQRVAIEVVPTSENSAPICGTDHVTQRSDGTGPVDVFLHPYCRDPDGDAFVVDGGPPGMHSDAPKHVPAGDGDSNWHYRTATFSGDESTTIWATDELGARSADTRLDVTVGPNVDRPPECSWDSTSIQPIYSRPGATRRFPIVCTDPDGDPFLPTLSSPPERGTMPLFVVGEPSRGFWGLEHWVDATYVPPDESLEPDPFAVTAIAPTGDGPAARYAIVPRALPENAGGGCGWSGATVGTDVPGEVVVTCSDGDGDPLSVEITTEPKHGEAGPAVVTPARYGDSTIAIPYMPDPGYEGYDCVKVRITDGHGLVFDLPVDISVQPLPPPAPPLPPLLPPPELPPVSLPGAPGAGGEPVLSAVRRALGTKAVKRLRGGGTQIWARSELSRADLVRYFHAPGVVVVCTKRCQISSDWKLSASGVRAAGAARPKALTAATARHPEVLSLTVGRPERRALGFGRKARAKFTVRVSAGGSPAIKLARSIPVSRR
jgi:hypothetical protein